MVFPALYFIDFAQLLFLSALSPIFKTKTSNKFSLCDIDVIFSKKKERERYAKTRTLKYKLCAKHFYYSVQFVENNFKYLIFERDTICGIIAYFPSYICRAAALRIGNKLGKLINDHECVSHKIENNNSSPRHSGKIWKGVHEGCSRLGYKTYIISGCPISFFLSFVFRPGYK